MNHTTFVVPGAGVAQQVLPKAVRWGGVAGRLLMGAVYVINGLGLMGAFGGVTQLMATKGVPMQAPLLALTIAAWLVGGLCIMAGWHSRLAALVLAAITVPVTLLIHGPWAADAAMFQNELNHFLKNIAMIGGLLVIAGSAPSSQRTIPPSAT